MTISLIFNNNSEEQHLYTKVSKAEDNVNATVTPISITLDYIYENYGWNTWEAQMFPSHQETLKEGDYIPNAFYVQAVDVDTNERGQILCSHVNRNYKIIQYSALRDFLQPFIDEQIISISSSLNLNNSRMAITCNIATDVLSVVENDKLYTKLIGTLAHDNSLRSLHFSIFDAVCENTLNSSQAIAFKSKDGFAIEKVDDFRTAKQLIDWCNLTFLNKTAEFKIMHDIILENEQVQNILKYLYNLPKSVSEDNLRICEENGEKISRAEKKYLRSLDAMYAPNIEARFGSPYVDNHTTGYILFNAVTDAMKSFVSNSFYGNIHTMEKLRNNLTDLILEHSVV